ncbi:hypothetical protein [Mesorhizobium sp.]|uniref:hypothetical protein n=1 Tax=Mesorhizobium sp. TaxID=1871066 RepID=UPI00342583E7
MVASYLMLIDVPDSARAIAEMLRVLKPDGTLLIANRTSFVAATIGGWSKEPEPRFASTAIGKSGKCGRNGAASAFGIGPTAESLHGSAAGSESDLAPFRQTASVRRRSEEG